MAGARLYTTIVPAPQNKHTRLVRGRGSPFLRGPGAVDYDCGHCGAGLLEGVNEGAMRDVIFQCPACGRFSRTMPLPLAAAST